MRRIVLLLTALIAALAPASPAAAIVYGVPDGTAHPNVGGLVPRRRRGAATSSTVRAP